MPEWRNRQTQSPVIADIDRKIRECYNIHSLSKNRK